MKQRKQDELLARIKDSGLTKIFIAEKIGVSNAHLSMMLNGNATFSEEHRNKINILLTQALKIAL
jgi:transcriptional regulator with XRE-family HTH domain